MSTPNHVFRCLMCRERLTDPRQLCGKTRCTNNGYDMMSDDEHADIYDEISGYEADIDLLEETELTLESRINDVRRSISQKRRSVTVLTDRLKHMPVFIGENTTKRFKIGNFQ